MLVVAPPAAAELGLVLTTQGQVAAAAHVVALAVLLVVMEASAVVRALPVLTAARELV